MTTDLTTPPAEPAQADADAYTQTIGELLSKGFKVTIEPAGEASPVALSEGEREALEYFDKDQLNAMAELGFAFSAESIAMICTALRRITGDENALAEWLESLHECSANGAISNHKWEAARRAAAVVRSPELILVHPDTMRLAESLQAEVTELRRLAALTPASPWSDDGLAGAWQHPIGGWVHPDGKFWAAKMTDLSPEALLADGYRPVSFVPPSHSFDPTPTGVSHMTSELKFRPVIESICSALAAILIFAVYASAIVWTLVMFAGLAMRMMK